MSHHHGALAATVAGRPVATASVDARESRLRAGTLATALPRAGTSEGRQLRRWLTQLVVGEMVVQVQAEALGIEELEAPTEAELLPDISARLELGSIAAAVLELPLARALFAQVTDTVTITDQQVAEHYRRNPLQFAPPVSGPDGWYVAPTAPPVLDQVRGTIAAHLLASARRRAFRRWLDTRRAEWVELQPGYEHPGDPRQPDHVHRH